MITEDECFCLKQCRTSYSSTNQYPKITKCDNSFILNCRSELDPAECRASRWAPTRPFERQYRVQGIRTGDSFRLRGQLGLSPFESRGSRQRHHMGVELCPPRDSSYKHFSWYGGVLYLQQKRLNKKKRGFLYKCGQLRMRR